MKNLRIQYGNITLFDGDVAEVSWQDSEDGVTVTGKTKKSSGSNFFELLAGAAKNKSEDEVGERKAAYEVEKAEKAAARKSAPKKVVEEIKVIEEVTEEPAAAE